MLVERGSVNINSARVWPREIHLSRQSLSSDFNLNLSQNKFSLVFIYSLIRYVEYFKFR